ncbi:ADP-ribosylation factor-like protein 6-interacting protein 6 isoform X2 [Megalopta genalis]|uniref:ADP-ribosylation factor-like protein 6-interacting protein 6 isoform X2 n=1 Tax=Megalopta genalis TaxID=115081 RepID=UPI001443676B|nr:ADP-ribosylation factor-like protein 6-interacting protein 6 isoform X2 [Megalopta genalis]
MMAEKKSDLHLNGKNVIERRNNYAAPVRLWDKLEINEWTFSLFLFVMSLTIVLGKLYMNYDVSKFNTKHLTATYGWLIKAAISGLIMMGFTWFIIYHDSSIPGINPPSPFSPSKQRFSKESSGVQMNYLFGLLNGILIFIYMCL